MKKLSFIMGIVALFTMSVVLVSCADDYGNAVNAPQRTDNTTTPTQPDPTDWHECLRRWNKVFENADVNSVLIEQHNNGKLDSLVLKYKYVFSLAADTTLYLAEAPTSELGFSPKPENTWISDYTHNAQGDSVATINYTKPYTLSNGVPLSLTTQRVRAYHMMGGRAEMYSEPTQKVGNLSISSTTTEFERNDSIFGLRTNECSVPLTLGGVSFTASATVKEIWFKAIKEKPEPSFDVFVNEPVSYLAGSMVQVVPTNNWKNVHLLTGANKVHAVVVTTDEHNSKVVSVEDKPVDRSRVIVNNQVNGGLYDSQTGLYVPAILTPDNKGWEGDGVVDGRHVEYSRNYTQLIDEGVKNFQETNTSKPTLTFSGVKAEITATWGEYEYTTITWTKYSKEGKAYMNAIVVKSPKK